jgi:Phospholipase_D-nuclease N-terminal
LLVGQYALLGLVAIAVVVALRFELLCLRDLAQRNEAELRYLTRTGWTIVIAFVIPIGGICYLYYGRDSN